LEQVKSLRVSHFFIIDECIGNKYASCMDLSSFPVLSSQLAFYFPKTIRPDETWVKLINDKAVDGFGQPIMVPLPDSADFDSFPAVIAPNIVEGWQLNISRTRLDLILNAKDLNLRVPDAKAKIASKAAALMAAITKEPGGINVSGIGYVTRFLFVCENPSLSLAKLLPAQLIRDGEFKNFFLQYSTKSSISGMNTLNISSLNLYEQTQSDGKLIKGVRIDRDFNTSQEKGLEFTTNNIADYIEKGSAMFEIEKITSLL